MVKVYADTNHTCMYKYYGYVNAISKQKVYQLTRAMHIPKVLHVHKVQHMHLLGH